MSDKGNVKKEMLERFKDMGIPTPMEPIANPQSKPSDPEKAAKLDEIRNGGLRGNFAKFIEKSEKTSAFPSSIPVPKVGKNPNEKTSESPNLKSFAPKSNSQASMIESMMFGDSTPSSSSYNDSSEVGDFGPTSVDTRAKLQQRLRQKQQEVQNNVYNQEVTSTSLTESELEEKIVSISKEVSKKMIKSVLLEFSKSSGGLIIESKNVKKAEVVGRNKVKIDGKTYKLTLDK
jgi:hypothetical protein